MKLQDLSIRLKLVLAVGLLLTVAIGGIVAGGVALMYSTAGAEAEARARSVVASYAAHVGAEIGSIQAMTAGVRAAVEGTLETSPVSRDGLGNLIRSAVAARPDIVGMTLAFEPNAVDGNDAAAIGHQYSDATGRFVPYFTNSPTGVNMDLLDMRPEAGTGEWYDRPVKENRDLLTPPYLYPIAGKDVLMSTISAVVRRDDKPIGIVTADMSLAAISTRMAELKPFGSGIVELISGENIWVASHDPKLAGQPVAPEIATALTDPMLQQKGVTYTNPEGVTMFVVTTPVAFAGLNEQWTMVMQVPLSVVYGHVEQMRDLGIVAGLGLLVVSLVLVWLGSSVLAKPISRMTALMGRIAKGEFDVEVPYVKARDEMGGMARAVEVFRHNGLKVAEMTEAEAARIIRDQEARSAMMAELQRSFGEVVDAAVAGDFSRRVDAEFSDAELNALAGSINNLVATVDRGLGETGEVLAALADTDLTKRMQGDYEGAFARLKNDTNAVADKLSGIVGQLKETSRGLKTATGEILSGANDLSERTTKQAATIEETSAAMEQLATTVLHNADRASEASKVASTVTRTAEEGGQVMGEANMAMERITQSSAKISNIIGLIDDIAFQTNLLALNASVEAARAGDAGKGFAVVAVEVRRLAQSAASASSEVKALIDQSGAEVKTGSRLVADAASRLQAMLEAARSSNALMDGIARESRQQASAIEEVNTAVRQLDEMTQHNAALVEQTNAAIEQTESQANELDRVVDIFTVSGSSPAAHARTPDAHVAPAKGIRGLQAKVKQAASSYLSRGNAAVDKDWAEF